METKDELIKKIKEGYNRTTIKQWGISYFEEYQDISEIPNPTFPFTNEKKEIILKRGKSFYAVFGVFFIIMFLMGLFGNGKVEVRSSHLFYGILGLIIIAASFFRRKKIFLINYYGIYYYKWQGYIQWHNVVCCFIKTTSDDSTEPVTTKELIIHYYFQRYHIYTSEKINLTNLDLNTAEIVSAIEYFRRK